MKLGKCALSTKPGQETIITYTVTSANSRDMLG